MAKRLMCLFMALATVFSLGASAFAAEEPVPAEDPVEAAEEPVPTEAAAEPTETPVIPEAPAPAEVTVTYKR